MGTRHIKEEITPADRPILTWIKPCTDAEILKYGSDAYGCHASKHLRSNCLASRIEKIKDWTEKNGGDFKLISKLYDKGEWCYELQGDDHVAFVQIRFPMGTKRNMKELMSTIYDPAGTKYV